MIKAKKIKLLKISSELGAGTRGSSMGFDGIKTAAEMNGSSILNDYEIISIQDENESLLKNINFPNAKRIKSIYEVLNRVKNKVKLELKKKNFPILISGDHSIAIGTIAGIKAAFPKKNIGIIWMDAHADIHSPFTTPSGNMHGMAIAASLGINNISSDSNTPKKEVIKLWDKIKVLGKSNTKIKPENIVYVGLRDTEWQEEKIIKKLNIKSFTVDLIRREGGANAAKLILKHLTNSDLIYLSFDVDVFDTSISLGTGTPVPNGLFFNEIELLIKEISQSQKICCFEIVEINPEIDNKGNKMAEIGLDVLETLIKSIKATS